MPAAREITILTSLAQALSRPADLGDALDAALETVTEVLGLETGWVWLLDAESDEPHLAAARALPDRLRKHPEAMHGDCYCLSTFRSGDLRGAANVNIVRCSRLAMLEDEACCTHPSNGFALRCHASVPLAIGGRRLGMLNVAAPDLRVLSEDELNLLTTVGALVSLVIERSRLEMESARAIAAEERNRIARDIHDTIAQGLAGLTMQLEAIDALAAHHDIAPIAAGVARALQLARNTLDEARCSVLDLRASPLDGKSLPDALRELVAETRTNAAPGVDIQADIRGFGGGMPDLPAAIEVGLYRITQQALANIMLHAHATRTMLRLERGPSRVHLRIEDNGSGFEPATVPPNRFGLVGMGERARLLGGRMTIETSADLGTVVDVEIPLRPRTPLQRPSA